MRLFKPQLDRDRTAANNARLLIARLSARVVTGRSHAPLLCQQSSGLRQVVSVWCVHNITIDGPRMQTARSTPSARLLQRKRFRRGGRSSIEREEALYDEEGALCRNVQAARYALVFQVVTGSFVMGRDQFRIDRISFLPTTLPGLANARR